MLKKISLVAIILICLVGCSENKVVNGIEIKISKIKDFNVSMTGIGGDYYIPAFSEGFLEVQNNSQQKGFVDKNGKPIGRCIYAYTNDFSEGLAHVVSLDYKHGFINENGKEVIPLIYDGASSFSGGLAEVEKDGKWGVINAEGTIIVDYEYDNIVKNDYLIAVNKDKKWSILDKNGEKIINDIDADEITYTRGFNEYLIIKKDGKYGVLYKTGQEMIPCEYDFTRTSEDVLTLCKGESDSVSIDRYGNEVEHNENKLEYKRKDGKIAFIDKNGNELTEFVYEYTYDRTKWSAGMLSVEREDKWGFIDKTGKEVIPCVYESVYKFLEGESLTCAKKGGKWGVIDKTGTEIIPFEYDTISSFSDGLACAVKIVNEKYAKTYILEQK